MINTKEKTITDLMMISLLAKDMASKLDAGLLRHSQYKDLISKLKQIKEELPEE